MTDDEKKAAEESFNHRLADVHRCWVKYALNLMSDSRDRLLDDSLETGMHTYERFKPFFFFRPKTCFSIETLHFFRCCKFEGDESVVVWFKNRGSI